MDSFSTFLNLIAQAKTPLAAGGLIAAGLVGILWQIAKSTSIDKDTLRLIVKGALGLAALVFILGFIGFMRPPPPVDNTDQKTNKPVTASTAPMPKSVLVLGTVFGDSDDTVGVPQAIITIQPTMDFQTRTVIADSNGSFQMKFDDVRVVTPARIWARAPGYKTSPQQVIALDPDEQHAEQRLITLVSTAVPASPAQAPQVSLVNVPANTVTQAAPPPTSWKEVLTAARGNEVKLVNAATDAFSQGNYAIAAQSLTQAKNVSPAGFWKTSYPSLAASYYLTGDAAHGKQTLDDMVADARDDVAHQGYLSNATTLDILQQDLNQARAKVPDTAKPDFDAAAAQVKQLSLNAKPVSAIASAKLHAVISKTFESVGH